MTISIISDINVRYIRLMLGILIPKYNHIFPLSIYIHKSNIPNINLMYFFVRDDIH